MFCYEVLTEGATWPILYTTESEALARAEALTGIDPEGRVWETRWVWEED